MTLSINKLFALPLCAILSAVPATAATNSLACDGGFEGKSARIIVTHAAGGGYDTFARIFAPHYEKVTGANTRVENWPAGKGRIGAEKIMSADPDGLTIGVLDASKHIVDHMISDGEQPDVLDNFTFLGRYARSQHVLLTGNESNIADIDNLFDMKPLPVFGTKSYRSSGLLATVLLGDLLQLKFDVVAGLGGTRKRVLAASRGDVDLISSNYFSINSDITAGTIRPLLQTSTSEISDHPDLKYIPVLGGVDGVAARRATELGIDVEKSIERAQAIESLISAGRILVAPAGLSDHLTSCLQDAVLTALQSAEFASDIKKANMVIDVASGPATVQELKNSQSEFEQLIPLLKQTIGKK